MSSTTLAPVYQDEINELYDVVAMVNARNSDDHHIIHEVRVHASGSVFKVRAMIDTGTIFNLIAQDLVKEHDIPGDDEVPSLTAANGGGLRLYNRHQVAIETYGHNGSWTSDAITIFGANITGCKLMLGMPWIRKAKPAFNWDTDKISFTRGPWVDQDLTLRSKQEGKRAVSAPYLPSSSKDAADPKPPDVALVGAEEFHSICQAEGTQAWMVEWSDLLDPGDNGAAGSMVGAVMGEDSGPSQVVLPEKYSDFSDVFDKARADVLPQHSQHDLAIELEADKQPPFGPIYDLSRPELDVLCEYVNEMLAKGFITPSKSLSGAPVLFTNKKDGGLRLCVDYRGLNAITKKNKHPLPLVRTLLDRLAGAKRYTKFDIIAAYNALRIRAGDEWKTAFRCRYGHFEYRVVPFGLVNAPAAFQAYINLALREYTDIFVLAYLDDIVVYSEREEDHTGHVRLVLQKLRQYNLYVKLSKCVFDAKEIEFLGFIVGQFGVSMDPAKLDTIATWPVPESFRDIQVFLGFANFYRRFIEAFSKVAAGLSDMLKGGTKGKFRGMKFVLTGEALESFNELKRLFACAPMLVHYDPMRRIMLECDASGFAISAILSQLIEETGQWHPVAFWSRKMAPPERNYGAGESEMLAVVEGCKHWRHYLEGATYSIRVVTDHMNLRTFLTTKNLSRREARWWERLSGLDLAIEYREGKKNPADGPSRRPDYMNPEDNGVMCIVGYVTQSSAKRAMAQEALEDRSQASSSPEVTVEPDNSESLLANNESNPRKESISAESSSDTESDIPVIYSPEAMREASRKRKRSANKSGAAKKRSKKIKTDAKLPEGTSKPTRLHLLRDDDLATRVKREEIKRISERESVFGAPSLELCTVLQALQETDPLAQKVRAKAAIDGALPEGMEDLQPPEPEPSEAQNPDKTPQQKARRWRVVDEIVCYGDQWYIPPGLLRRELLHQHHDNAWAGHFAHRRTLDLLQRKFYWPKMSADVDEYVKACADCRRTKPRRHLPYGELQSLPIPKGPRQDWTLDFITDLPPSVRRGQVFDAVLVVVDRYTKFARYIPARKDWEAEDMADVLVEEVFTKYGKPVSFVSDRGSLFTSKFWSHLCYYLSIRLGYSTAFHPQTDGQTERQNQTLEQYLRGFVNYQQDDWVFWLSLAEYAYNNSVHSSTGISPFEALFGEKLSWEDAVREEKTTDIPAARKRALNLAAMRKLLEKRLTKAVAAQAKHYNSKHKPRKYNVGDLVYLNSRNIESTRPSKKLDWKFYGPYKVIEPVGKQAYKLNLPQTMKIHNVFHVSLLEPCDGAHEGNVPPPPPINVEGEDEYEVEEILDSRSHYGKLQYFVKWMGYPHSENQWLSEEDVAGSKDLVDLFHRLYPEKPTEGKGRKAAKKGR